jgi:putative hydrolase of the HAD superfamily
MVDRLAMVDRLRVVAHLSPTVIILAAQFTTRGLLPGRRVPYCALVPLLLLDLDNTLLDRAGPFRAWAESFLSEIEAPADDIDWLVAIDADGLTDRWDLADAIRRRYGLQVAPSEVVDALDAGLAAHTRLDPLIACALRIAVGAGWVPVVVSNGTARQEDAKIRRTGLDRYVADWVISEEVGVSKPNPRIFALAAQRVRMHLRGAWVVGDGPEADIGGAVATGLPSIWLHRGRNWMESRYGPTRVADGLIPAIATVLAAAHAPRRQSINGLTA